MVSCRYLDRSPEIRRFKVSRTLPEMRRSSRRMESSSGEAPSAISSSERIAVVMASSSARLPVSRPNTGVSVVFSSCSASYTSARRAVCSRLATSSSSRGLSVPPRPARARIAPTARMPPKPGLPCRIIRFFASVVWFIQTCACSRSSSGRRARHFSFAASDAACAARRSRIS